MSVSYIQLANITNSNNNDSVYDTLIFKQSKDETVEKLQVKLASNPNKASVVNASLTPPHGKGNPFTQVQLS